MIGINVTGSSLKTELFLKAITSAKIYAALESYGRAGVAALAGATPVDSGLSSESWNYEIKRAGSAYSISWTNSHTVDGTPLVILLQYGHGTGTGGYVQGRDFINPAIRPVFDKIAEGVWKAVTSA